MKYNHIRSILSLVTAAAMLPVIPVNSSAAESTTGLTDLLPYGHTVLPAIRLFTIRTAVSCCFSST